MSNRRLAMELNQIHLHLESRRVGESRLPFEADSLQWPTEYTVRSGDAGDGCGDDNHHQTENHQTTTGLQK